MYHHLLTYNINQLLTMIEHSMEITGPDIYDVRDMNRMTGSISAPQDLCYQTCTPFDQLDF